MKIGVDVMGGDFFPQAPIKGAILAKNEFSCEIVLVGQKDIIEKELERQGIQKNTFEIVHASEIIGMSEHPTKAATQKKDSSINVGIKLAKIGELDAFISAGNTGAMLVSSVFGLKNIEGVIRPTIGTNLPYRDHFSFISDVGANTDCKPEFLNQFALLSSIYSKEVMKVENPRVALLSIGEEEAKGDQLTIAAHKLLRENSKINFIGNKEGRDINSTDVDIYICDGFVGNIVLKFTESFFDVLKHKLGGNTDQIQEYNYETYGGIPILGIEGVSIIGHGMSSPRAYKNMISKAKEMVDAKLVEKIKQSLN